MSDRKWFEGMRPEDLPGDLELVARECGMEVALSLAEKMGSVSIYIRPLDGLISRKKEDYILRNFDGSNHKELAIATGYSERWVYEILRRERDDRQTGLFENGR